MNTLKKIQYSDQLLVAITICISLIAFVYFYTNGQANLSYYDAVARLNTARKMIDSITPGIGQLGGIWLPFPQILMVPLIWNNFLWHTGLAGYLISGTIFVIGAVYLQKAVYLITANRKVSLLIWFLFVSNINILLLQTMAMSEVFYAGFFILTSYFLLKWSESHSLGDFLWMAACVMVLTLTRYEGYFVFIGVFLAIILECVRTYTRHKKDQIEGLLLLFLTVAGFGIILWCIYSALFYKDPFFWLHAYTPKPVSLLQTHSIREQLFAIQNPTLVQSLIIYSSVIFWTNGVITVLMGLIGLIIYMIWPVRRFFSFFIMNEPRSTNQNTMNSWLVSMASYIKTQDTNHLVFAGTEVATAPFTSQDESSNLCENNEIDICSVHLYLFNQDCHIKILFTKEHDNIGPIHSISLQNTHSG